MRWRGVQCSRVTERLTSNDATRTKTRGTKNRHGCGHRGDQKRDADHSADGETRSGSGVGRDPAGGLGQHQSALPSWWCAPFPMSQAATSTCVLRPVGGGKGEGFVLELACDAAPGAAAASFCPFSVTASRAARWFSGETAPLAAVMLASATVRMEFMIEESRG